ncbi:MAG: glycosyltransferase family 2 protein [bacterium]
MSDLKVLVLIPAKNESAKITEVVHGVRQYGFDVLVVDDGSTDETGKLASSAGAVVLCHALNRGQGASIKTGIEYAIKNNYSVVVFFDADGQMLAKEISFLAEPVLKGEYEVVLGSRNLGHTINMPYSKKIVKKMALWFTKITTGLKITDTHNGFQAWSLQALKKIDLSQDRMAYASEILAEIKNKKIKYRELPVTISYTDYSVSKGQSIFNAFNILWDLVFKK